MAISDYANSTRFGKPVFLLLFTYGTGLHFAYTTHTRPIETTLPGEESARTFTPLPIEFDDVEVKGAPDDDEFEITVPRTSGIATLFTAYPPTEPIAVVIYEGNIVEASDPAGFSAGAQYDFLYRGTVIESAREGATATLTTKPLTAALQRPALTQFYQLSCQIALYGVKCRADRASKTTTGTVASLTANTVTLAAAWGLSGVDTAKYVGGEVRWTSDYGTEVRRILKVAGNVLTIAGVFRDLAADDTISVVLGCGHTLTDCTTLHDNAVNYRGYPFIPDANPVGKNNHT